MKFLTNNLGWKLLSLLIAVALWIAVAREPELATTLTVPIEYKNIPQDLDMGASTPERVRIEVRGPSGRLERDNLADAALILDLADAVAGERTYTIQAYQISLPFGVSFHRAVPSQITLRFQPILTRQVPIEPRYLKPPPEGYQVRAFTLDPEQARIVGPEERVKAVTRVLTDPVDLSGVVGDSEFRTHLNAGDPQVRLEPNMVVTLKVILEKTPVGKRK